jgi:hypothetical protein
MNPSTAEPQPKQQSFLYRTDAEFTARHSRNEIGKQGFTTENAEFAEIFYFKVPLSLSPRRLRGEFSI